MMKQDKKVVLLSEEPESVEKPQRAEVSRVAPAWQLGSGEELEIPACVLGEVAEWSRQHNPITCQSPVHLSAASQQPDGLPPDPTKQEVLHVKNATNTRAGWCRAGGRELLVKSGVMWLLKPCSVKVKREALWRPLGEWSCSSGRPEDLNGAEPKSPSRASGYKKQPPCSENPRLSRAGFSPKRVLSRPQRCHMGRGPADDPLTATSQTGDTPQGHPRRRRKSSSRPACENGSESKGAQQRTHKWKNERLCVENAGNGSPACPATPGDKTASVVQCGQSPPNGQAFSQHLRVHLAVRPEKENCLKDYGGKTDDRVESESPALPTEGQCAETHLSSSALSETPLPDPETAPALSETPLPDPETAPALSETPLPDPETAPALSETPLPDPETAPALSETPLPDPETAPSDHSKEPAAQTEEMQESTISFSQSAPPAPRPESHGGKEGGDRHKAITRSRSGKSLPRTAFPQAHVTVHTGESGFSRRQCEITQKHLRGHKKNNAEARTHSCVVCEDSFSSPGELKDHQRVHFGQKLFSCTECSKMFTTVKYLKVHERCHSGKSLYSCETCGKGFITPYSLKIHGRSHTGEKPFGCQQCGKCFSHISNLHKHRRIHTGEKRFMCEMCGRSFTQLSQLTKHQRSHAEKPPCRPGAKRAWTRCPRSQMQTQAAAQAAHSCPTCGKSYKSKSALTLHLKLHTGVRLFQCQECEKSFIAQWALTEHMRTHSDDRPYKCEVCGKSFSRVSGVQKHKRTHAGEKPYGCPECGKAFSSSQTLRSHRLAHVEEESPHRCTQCGKGFVTRGNLKKHMLIHSAEKAHRCGQCAMSFIERSTLRIHQRIHTGEKPFSCDHCGKSFSQKSNLKKHTLTHTARTHPPLSAKHAVSAEQ